LVIAYNSLMEKQQNRILGKNYRSIRHIFGSKNPDSDKYLDPIKQAFLTKKHRGNDLIINLEKYDGTNTGVVKVDDIIYPITRQGYKATSSPFRMHHDFADWVKFEDGIFDFLKNGERLVFEWLGSHGLSYSGGNIVLLDMFDSNNKRVPFFDLINLHCKVPLARVLHMGRQISIDDSMALLMDSHTHDIKCNDTPEGMVYRREVEGKFDYMGKFVRHDFEAGKNFNIIEQTI